MGECDAPESLRRQFIYDATVRGITEWRIPGNLGLGGKLRQRDPDGPLTVDCYPEDMTGNRGEVLARTNQALRHLEEIR